MFKIHPEVPESLSLEAKSFILRCFEPDPHKRALASDLLRDTFVRQLTKGKKSKIAFKPSGEHTSTQSGAQVGVWLPVLHGRFLHTCVFADNIHSVSLPVQLQCEATGSSSSEHGSVSPDCDSKHDVFFHKKKSCSHDALLKRPNSNYLRYVTAACGLSWWFVCELLTLSCDLC